LNEPEAVFVDEALRSVNLTLNRTGQNMRVAQGQFSLEAMGFLIQLVNYASLIQLSHFCI